MYDADQRYQSMEEMILDIEKLMYDVSLGYKKEHKNSSLVAGTIMLGIGVVAWKITMAPCMIIGLSLWEYIFWGLCLTKGVLKAFKKDVFLISTIILGVGIYLMATLGFSGGKLLLLLWMVFSFGASSGYLSAGVLIANFVSLIQCTKDAYLPLYTEYSWVAITVISIALVLIYQYELLSMEDRKTANFYYKKGLYWGLIVLVYAAILINGLVLNSHGRVVYENVILNEMTRFLYSFDGKMVGIYGLGFCAFWILREKFLIFQQKRRLK